MRFLVPEWHVANIIRMACPREVHPAIHRNLSELAAFLNKHLPLEVLTPSAGEQTGTNETHENWSASNIRLRDYHPLGVIDYDTQERNQVAFRYEPPDSYRGAAAGFTLCQQTLNKGCEYIPLMIAGGNLVHNGVGDLIMTERVLSDNIMSHGALAKQLRAHFEVRRLIVIPEQPGDATGHVDGSVRFVDADTVAVTTYPQSTAEFSRWYEAVKTKLHPHYRIIPIESEDPLEIRGDGMPSAFGNRLNWIRWRDKILFPSFRAEYDTNLVHVLAKESLHAVAVPQSLFELVSHFGGSLHSLTTEYAQPTVASSAVNAGDTAAMVQTRRS
jgi:agmatine/peptidylarginine deiminase